MTDYIGKYVKKFESGTRGSLALGSCGNDWGLSCGSYQLTLRWGNCINFLKKYFPSESSGLFFNSSKTDIAQKTWPGSSYCSSPDAVRSVWQKCYNKVGAEVFFEYEHAWIESQYYIPIKNKIKSYLNLDTCGERAFQECFWSWAVHRGSGGAYSEFISILTVNNITSLDYFNKEVLFDLIYDKRYQTTGNLNRYKKGLMNGDSERELLRPLLSKGTFSGKEEDHSHEEDADCGIQDALEDIMDTWIVDPVVGYAKVILRDDVLNIRRHPRISENIVRTVSYGEVLNVVGKVEGRDFYELEDGLYVSSNPKYVQFTEINFDPNGWTNPNTFTIRVKGDEVVIFTEPNTNCTDVGTIHKNEVYTIVEVRNGFGRLKSGAGWISLDPRIITRLT